MANTLLDKYKRDGYVYIPEGIQTGTFLHCSFDNIDLLEATIDGKNTLHSTQLTAWQRKSGGSECLQSLASDLQPKVLDKDAMENFHKLDKAKLPSSDRNPPGLPEGCDLDMTLWLGENSQIKESQVQNLTWIVTRNHHPESTDQPVPLWGAYNECGCVISHPITNVGMLPILQAPADDYDTVTTVINKFQALTRLLGQTFTVITADQPLYSKGKELLWANQNAYKNVVFCMGGLHICFNFLRAIGQHMAYSGLEDIWVETGIFSQNTASKVLEGKAYYRGVRGHLLTYEALWRLKLRYFRDWLIRKNVATPNIEFQVEKVVSAISSKDQREEIYEKMSSLAKAIKDNNITDLLEEFDRDMSTLKNFAYWLSYLRMVELLLSFIRAQRIGDWSLHVQAFSGMLPWLTIYDHINYARWGPVYLADMKALEVTAPEVYEEFLAGNFVVKRSNNFFNEVPVDHATEWVNKICKTAGGVIGITRTDQARDRFCITWSSRSTVSQRTKQMLGLFDDDEEITTHRNDSQKTRVKSEESKVIDLVNSFESLDVFGIETQKHNSDSQNDDSKLISIATKDVCDDAISCDLLSCETRGCDIVKAFTRKRLEERSVNFFAPIKRNNSKTFAFLYKSSTNEKVKASKVLKADKKILQRLLQSSR